MFMTVSKYQYAIVTSSIFSEKIRDSLFGPSYIKKTIAAVSAERLGNERYVLVTGTNNPQHTLDYSTFYNVRILRYLQ